MWLTLTNLLKILSQPHIYIYIYIYIYGYFVFYFFIFYFKSSLAGLLKLKSLNIRCCKCVTDLDLKAISGNCSHKLLCFLFTIIPLL